MPPINAADLLVKAQPNHEISYRDQLRSSKVPECWAQILWSPCSTMIKRFALIYTHALKYLRDRKQDWPL
jgi:hypothetical protein